MPERRIAYAKDKGEFIKRLVASDESSGPFELIADVLAFAAALGLRRGRRIAIVGDTAEPIRQDVFDRRAYDTMMNLVALHDRRDATVLADADEATDQRATAFEEYANGGLTILQEELKGAVNLLETIVLLVNAERSAGGSEETGFDLSKLVA
jgi:dnd system-associated protein 4